MSKKTGFSSGMDSLDEILDGIMPGDNIVWQVDNINDFIPTLDPYFDYINKNKEKLVYFRFANHAPFVPDHIPAIRYELNPHEGFEPFISKILNVIEEHGKGVYYIFDSLSDLAVDWYSDRMLGNFFMLTCPYLYIFDTVTYFVLLKDSHTSLAVNAIFAETVPNNIRGRAYSAVNAYIQIFSVVSMSLSGITAETFGIVFTIVGVGICLIMGTFLFAVFTNYFEFTSNSTSIFTTNGISESTSDVISESISESTSETNVPGTA